jgi:hypothetical protein
MICAYLGFKNIGRNLFIFPGAEIFLQNFMSLNHYLDLYNLSWNSNSKLVGLKLFICSSKPSLWSGGTFSNWGSDILAFIYISPLKVWPSLRFDGHILAVNWVYKIKMVACIFNYTKLNLKLWRDTYKTLNFCFYSSHLVQALSVTTNLSDAPIQKTGPLSYLQKNWCQKIAL